MQMSFTKKIGWRHYTFTADGKNLYEMVSEAQRISFPDVPKCGLCQDENLVLGSHEAQGYKYTEIICLSCRAKVNFGQRKDDSDTFFLRRAEGGGYDWKPYIPKDGEKAQQKPPAKAQSGPREDATPPNESDLPF